MKTIFLTGATGFLGSHFLYHLLQHTDDIIFCLARDKGPESAASRICQKLCHIHKSNCEAGISNFCLEDKIKTNLKIVTGDITEENLGLKETLVNQQISECWHIAARVQFTEMNREKVMETNVRGGRNVLKFIRENNIEVLNFISTAYVAGKKTGNIEECLADDRFPVNNVYEQSKRIVEQEIIEASLSGNFDYRIFRPSIIVGHSVTYQPDYCNGGLYGFLYLYATIENQVVNRNTDYSRTDRIKLYGDKNSTLSLISIDHVVNLLFQIANQEKSTNQIYHITPPVEIRLEKIVEIVNSLFELQMELVTTNADYNGNDRLFNRQVNHYRSYLFYRKHFERRDIYNGSNDTYNLNDKKLYKLIENFYRQCKKGE